MPVKVRRTFSMLRKTPSILPPEEQYIKELEAKIRLMQAELDQFRAEENTFTKANIYGFGHVYFKAYSVKVYDAFDGFVKCFEPRYSGYLAKLLEIAKRP